MIPVLFKFDCRAVGEDLGGALGEFGGVVAEGDDGVSANLACVDDYCREETITPTMLRSCRSYGALNVFPASFYKHFRLSETEERPKSSGTVAALADLLDLPAYSVIWKLDASHPGFGPQNASHFWQNRSQF